MSIDYQELLEKLKMLPVRLERLVEQHPNDLLCQAGAGGGWGAVEIMAFLRDWDEVVLDRIDQILTTNQPEFQEEDPELWSIERDYHAEDPENVCVEVREGREELVDRITGLTDAQWQRTGTLADGSTMSLEEIVVQRLESDRQQLQALREMLH
jgi:hypothetical protein